ncbi:MAG: succinyl-diaminopimelate desuccinylase [Rickettsiales bacterium]
MLDTVNLAIELMRQPSVTPDGGSCFDLIASWLEPLGFRIIRQTFHEHGTYDTENFYARLGDTGPNVCFAGHVDVVPPGDVDAWSTPPFEPEIRKNYLYGRGAEDMKGAIAAMIAAAAKYTATPYSHTGSISFLFTADEEGSAINGTRKMLGWLYEQGEAIDYCIVGEPTNPENVGDMAKIGRRGSINATLTVKGVQGHVAYPERASNPITLLLAMLVRLKSSELDTGSEFFPPSNLEITTIDVGNPSENTIPARATAKFNIRFNDHYSGVALEQWIRAQCDMIGGDYTLAIRISGESFLSPPGLLSDALVKAVKHVTGRIPELSTTGGTSDARFIKDFCPVIEFGTTGLTPHQVDERVSLEALKQLTEIYHQLIVILLSR